MLFAIDATTTLTERSVGVLRLVSLDTKVSEIWVLCRNVPVLVSVHNLRPANDAEALARSVLKGDPIVPSEIVEDGQKFIDARGPEHDPGTEQPPPEDDYEPSLAPSMPALEELEAPVSRRSCTEEQCKVGFTNFHAWVSHLKRGSV